MTKTELEDYIRSCLNLGTTADAFIPVELARAAQNLERNHDFLYLEVERPVLITPSTMTVDLTDGLKRVVVWRFKDPDTLEWHHIVQVDPQDPVSAEEEDDRPLHWYMDYGGALVGSTGRRQPRAVLNFTLDNVETELIESIFTDYKSLAGAAEPWLFKFGEDLVTAETIIKIAPILREPDLIALWQKTRDEALATILEIDYGNRQGAQDPFSSYRG